MKCVNPSVDEDAILFNCPFCNMDAEVDETTLAALWSADAGGTIACPPPEGCGKEYILPTLPQVSALRAKAELAAPSASAATPAAAEPPPSTLDATGQIEPPPSTSPTEAVTPQPAAAAPPPSSSDLEKEVEQAVKELTDSAKKSKPAARPLPQKPATTSNGGMQMAIRTFRHGDWQGGGEDNFDDEVTRFLEEIGLDNVVSVTPMTYTDKDDKMIDYGVMIVFKRPAGAAAKAAEEPVVWVD